MALLIDEGSLDGTGLAVIVGAVAAGCAVTYFLSQRAFKRTIVDLRRELDERLNSTVAKIQTQPAAVVAPAVAQTPLPIETPVKAAPPPREEVTPETLLVLAAAVTAFLGKKVRIRSAKMLYAHESFNAWSQQGRVVVQASHNLAQGY